MRDWSRLVRIEKHRAEPGGISFLTFADQAAADSGDRPPLVFVVHGLLSRKERHSELCLALAHAGFTACALDARGHGERVAPPGGARLDGALGLEFLQAFADAVVGTSADLPSVADYLGRDDYGVIGHSMGGYVALRAAASDERARVIVSVAGNPDWSLLPQGAGAFYLPPELADLARRESPLGQAARIFPRPLLMLHGDADTVVPIAGHRALRQALRPLYDAAAEPRLRERLSLVEYPGIGHEWLPDMAERAVAWMGRYLTESG